MEGNRDFADGLLKKISYVPGTADLRIQQPFDRPYLQPADLIIFAIFGQRWLALRRFETT